MATEWLLLTFHDNYADEFDCEAIIVTTQARWEAAQVALRSAYPGDARFDASIGANERNCYTADEYLSKFKAHAITLDVARALAVAIRGRDIKQVYDAKSKRNVSFEWFLTVGHGLLPRVPDDEVQGWHLLLAFHAPPGRCAAHGNVIGECDDRTTDPAMPWGPRCRKDAAVRVHTPDPDYDALVGGA